MKFLAHERSERGNVIVIALLLLLLGALLVPPALSYLDTALDTVKIYQRKTASLYAADSGLMDAYWRARHPIQERYGLEALDNPKKYEPYDFETTWTYSPGVLNGYPVTVSIQNVWVPEHLDAPASPPLPAIIEARHLVIWGEQVDDDTYQVHISAKEIGVGNPLGIEEVGAWLPPGFHYTGSPDLDLITEDWYCPGSVSAHAGGERVLWRWDPALPIDSLPNYAYEGPPLNRHNASFQFEFSSDEEDRNPEIPLWIATDAKNPHQMQGLSWDADVRLFRITSEAGDAKAHAYVSKGALRHFSSTIAGDYAAIGNGLLGGHEQWHDALHEYSSATLETNTDADREVNELPADATIEQALLYWAGWMDYSQYESLGGGEECESLRYPSNPSTGDLQHLIEDCARVNRVMFGPGTWNPAAPGGSGTMVMVDYLSGDIRVKEPELHPDFADTWYYACRADVTDIVRGWIDGGDLPALGPGVRWNIAVGHVVEANEANPAYEVPFANWDMNPSTGYPLGYPAPVHYGLKYQYAFAGWSLVLIYSSPQTAGHQLYLYDDMFQEAWGGSGSTVPDNPDFDGDGEEGGIISGFLIPEDVTGHAAKMTAFVLEGDGFIHGDTFAVNGYALASDQSAPDNVWDGDYNSGLHSVFGIDIDTFTVSPPVVKPGDTTARIDLVTQSDGFTLAYLILSFESHVTTGGALTYKLDL